VLGVCLADISLNDRLSLVWEDALYTDNQQHLPCPESLMDFTLPNGLSIKAVVPLKHYKVVYEGIDDTRFELDFHALHEPYDINDPEMDPTAAARNKGAWDKSWSGGHYETTYRVTGDLIVRGKHYTVDCVDTGDRSWGPREERDNTPVIWWHASFGERFTVHLFTGLDVANTADMGSHISGYVLEDGQVYGLTDSRGTQDYYKALPMGGILEVTDVRGKTFEFSYSARNCSYWGPSPFISYLQTYMRVNHNGEMGHGVQQLAISKAYFARNRDGINRNT
jgi:hypothetical protein